MRKGILKRISVSVIIFTILVIFKGQELTFYIKMVLEVFKINADLPTISSNFYDDPISDPSFKDIVYKKRGNLELKLDIYSPNKNLPNGAPVIIYVYGDGWMYGDKTLPSSLLPVIKTLRDSGYAVICTSYELLTTNLIFDKQISDVKDTIRWIYKNKNKYKFNTDNIGIIAPSAGAQLSMIAAYSPENSFIGDSMLSSYSSKIKYLVDLFGPSDLSKLNFSEAPSSLMKKIGMGNLLSVSQRYSPQNYITGDLPNTLIIHSNNDNLVPYSTSIDLYNRGKSYGNDFELYTLDNCTHYLENLSSSEALILYMKIINYIIANTN